MNNVVVFWIERRKTSVVEQYGWSYNIVAESFFQHVERFIELFILHKPFLVLQKAYLMRNVVVDKVCYGNTYAPQRTLHFIAPFK